MLKPSKSPSISAFLSPHAYNRMQKKQKMGDCVKQSTEKKEKNPTCGGCFFTICCFRDQKKAQKKVEK